LGDLISLNFSRAAPGPGWLLSYLYKTDYLYLPTMYPPMSLLSLFHLWTAVPISSKFWTVLHTNSGKVLNTSMNLQPYPVTLGYPKLQNLKIDIKYPDGCLIFPGQRRPRLDSYFIVLIITPDVTLNFKNPRKPQEIPFIICINTYLR